jgi:DNA-binding MarR family transcriptional regulator
MGDFVKCVEFHVTMMTDFVKWCERFIFLRDFPSDMRSHQTLTEKDKNFIRKIAKVGPYTKAELARLYRVSRSRITQITKEVEEDGPQDDS